MLKIWTFVKGCSLVSRKFIILRHISNQRTFLFYYYVTSWLLIDFYTIHLIIKRQVHSWKQKIYFKLKKYITLSTLCANCKSVFISKSLLARHEAPKSSILSRECRALYTPSSQSHSLFSYSLQTFRLNTARGHMTNVRIWTVLQTTFCVDRCNSFSYFLLLTLSLLNPTLVGIWRSSHCTTYDVTNLHVTRHS